MGRRRAAHAVSSLLFVATAVLACGGDSDSPTEPPPPEPTVGAVTVSPDATTAVTLGETRQFQATVTDQQGAPFPGATVTWSSSDAQVATVDATGLATAVGEGEAVIQAEASGVMGSGTFTVIDAESRLFNGMAVARTENDSIPLVAAAAGGDLLGVIGEMAADGGIESTRGAILLTGGDAFTYWFNEEGLPERAVFNDYALVFRNYTATTVDVNVVAPDGSTSTLEDIELAEATGVDRPAASAGSARQDDVWAALRGVGDGVASIQCSSSMAEAAGSVGLSLLPCVDLIVAAGQFVEDDNEGLERSGLAFTIVEGVDCPGETFEIESCVSFVANGLGDAYDGATDQVTSLSDAAIEVTAVTSGDVIDSDGYVVVLEPDLGMEPLALETNGAAVRWDELLPGPYTVTLTDVSSDCELASGNPVDVSLGAGQQVVVAFVVECGGVPPAISNLVNEVLEVNTCDPMDGGPNGSVKRFTFDYTDENGDAGSDATLEIVFEFQLADGTTEDAGAAMIPVAQIGQTGDGSSGQVTFVNCVRWGPASLLIEDITLLDAAGNASNTLHDETPRPVGANAGKPALVALPTVP